MDAEHHLVFFFATVIRTNYNPVEAQISEIGSTNIEIVSLQIVGSEYEIKWSVSTHVLNRNTKDGNTFFPLSIARSLGNVDLVGIGSVDLIVEQGDSGNVCLDGVLTLPVSGNVGATLRLSSWIFGSLRNALDQDTETIILPGPVTDT